MIGGKSQLEPTLVILAAGAGTRYGSLKQLAPIGPGGATLLEYSVFDALRAGFGKVVLVIRPETESGFRDRFDARMAGSIPVAYAHQTLGDLPTAAVSESGRVKPWGTGQAVLAAAPEIDGPFAVINADDFYGAESFATLSRFWGERRRRSSELAVVGFRVADTLTDSGPVSRALCELDETNHLRDIVEILRVWRREGRIVYQDSEGLETLLSEDQLVSMNMWGFTPGLLPEVRRQFGEFLKGLEDTDEAEFLLPDVIRSVVREGRFGVEVLTGAGEWCGLTFREDHERVTESIAGLVAQGRYPRELWK